MIKRFGQLLRLAATALLPVIAAGCLPNATWLPDSSGFVYTGGKDKDKLYVYDLEKKESHILVEKGAGPAWPAVSPDGKRIAVALRKDVGKAVSLEVIVFDRDGKELQHSEKMNWAKRVDGPDLMAAQAFWAPGQDKLLLSTDGVSGFYDLKTKGFTKLGVNVATFGSSPIRPDGKGFLAYKLDEDNSGYFFVDWDGKEKNIELTPKEGFGRDDSSDTVMLFYPLMHSSRWDGSMGVVSWNDMRIKVDAEKFTATSEHIKPALSADKNIIQDQLQLADGGIVRAVELSKRYKKDRGPGDWSSFGSYRVEVVKQGAKKAQTLMDGAGYFMIYPSPDGKKAVVKCSKTLEAIFTESKPEQDMLYLIDGLGDVTAKIDLAK